MAKLKKGNNNSNYYKYFDLTRDPFPIESYDNILFLTPEMTSSLEEIKRNIIESDQLILVLTVPGAGKSTIADYFESIPEKNWKVALVQAETNMDKDSISHEIIQQVSPDKADDKSFAISQLYKFLEFTSKTEQIPVFIIDDAQKLPVGTLEFILELTALKYQETAFRFVLFADENINDKLNTDLLSDLNKKLVTRINLPALAKSQLKEYINTRLSSCGEINKYPFTDEDFQSIYSNSAGIPRSINKFSRQIMESRSSSFSIGFLSPKLIAAVLFITIGIALYFTIIDRSGLLSGMQQSVATDDQLIGTTPDPVSPITSIQGTLTTDETLNSGAIDEFQQSEQLARSVSMDTIATDTDTTIIEEKRVPVINSLVSTDQADTLTKQAVSDPEELDVAITDVVAGMESEQKDIPLTIEDEPPEESIEKVETGVVLTSSAINPDQLLNIYKLDNIPDKIAGIKGATWYKEQSRTSYSLQLISASDISNVVKLLQGLDEFHEEMSGYVKYTPSGRPRYLLFFGLYPDKESAISAAASSVPDKIKTIDPYPRSIGDIVDEIDELGSWPR